MGDFIQFCNQLSQLEKEAGDDLSNKLKSKSFRKGNQLLKSGEVCRQLYFINSGLTKTFFYKNDKEFIMLFLLKMSCSLCLTVTLLKHLPHL